MKLVRVAVLLACTTSAWAQLQPDRTVRLDFSNPALIPAMWTLELHPDGSGHFQSQRGAAPRSEVPAIEPPDVNRDIRVSTAFAAHVLQVAARQQFFRKDCDSHQRVAFVGSKRLSYAGPDTGPAGHGECTFNYSGDREIQNLGDSLVAVAVTVIEGAKLERLRQHDRLGLDHELEVFADRVHAGQAMETGTIRETLEQLAGDDSLMERVRRRAQELLSQAAE